MGSRVRLRFAADDRLVAAIRSGDPAAFEVLYERHAGELYSFCVYMLRSRHDAEDALQATFASAYRSLRAHDRQINLRPWLFAIARNACVSVQRRRRPTVELNGEPALSGDPVRGLELKEEVRGLVADLGRLPERQRTALVLTELHGLSQVEIAGVLGVRAEQVKAYVYQARSNLLSERRARDADCRQIREELASARGATLLKGRLRRHVRTCAGCRDYAGAVSRQRRQLAAILPLVPSLVLRHRTLEDVLGIGAADPATYAGGAAVGAPVAGAAFEFAGGGIKALAVKVAAAIAAVGASAGVGVSALAPAGGTTSAAGVTAAPSQRLVAAAGPQGTVAGLAGASVAGSPGLGPRNAVATVGVPAPGAAGRPDSASGQGGNGAGAPAGTPAGDAPRSGADGKERGVSERSPKESARAGGGAGDGPRLAKGAEGRALAGEARARAAEERQRGREERRRAREPRERASKERRLAREERKRLREEGGPGQTARPPKTEEERKLARERREERQLEHEREAPEGTGSEPAP